MQALNMDDIKKWSRKIAKQKEKGTHPIPPKTDAPLTEDNDLSAAKKEYPLLNLIQQDTGVSGRASASGGETVYSFSGICPVCGHKDCFRYYKNTNTWKCFSASNENGTNGGSAIDYLLATHRASTVAEAAKIVREKTGYEYKKTQPDGARTTAKKRVVSKGKKFDHAAVAQTLINDYGACFIGGMPAIRPNGKEYRCGWNNFYELIIGLAPNSTKANREEVCNYLSALQRTLRREQSKPTLLAFQNGVLDLEILKLRDWQTDDCIINIVPHNWNRESVAQAQVIVDFLDALACNDNAVRANLIELAGLCLYRGTEYPTMAVFLGSGANGKSTYINTLKALLGEYNFCCMAPKEIANMQSSFRLQGMLANLGDDISSTALNSSDLSVIKKCVTGESISANPKYQTPYSFEPYATLIFSANEMPTLRETDDGIMRRMFPIPFSAKFKGSNCDPHLIDKLTDETVQEALCQLAVNALIGITENGGLTANELSDEMKQDIRLESDSVAAWLGENMYTSYSLCGRTTDSVFAEYKAWADTHNLPNRAVLPQTKFTQYFTSKQVPVYERLESKTARVDGLEGVHRCFFAVDKDRYAAWQKRK